MKKFLLLMAAILSIGFSARSADPVITITTNKAVGEQFELVAYCTTEDDAFTVDWGDGTTKTYNVDPNGYGYAQRIRENLKGQTIKITGPITYLNCPEMQISSFKAEGEELLKKINLSENALTSFTSSPMPALTELDLSENQLTALDLTGFSSLQTLKIGKNKITTQTLNIADVAGTLSQFSAPENELVTLNMKAFAKLENFDVSDNKNFTTAVFMDGNENLKYIDMSGCDLVHFYAITLPNLRTLSLNDNSLWDLEKGTYPNLSTLNISNNGLSELDVTEYLNLTSLYCNGNKLTEINVSNNTELTALNVSDNQIKELNLLNNKNLTGLYCSNNLLKKLDISNQKAIQYLNISHNDIRYIELKNAYSLREITATNTLIPGFYFNYVNTFGRFSKVDVRNNKNMTSESINVMFKTMPQRTQESYSPTILIEGSNGEHSDPSYPQSSDMQWKVDVQGDATAQIVDTDVTIDATNTGEKITVTGEFGGMASDQTFEFTKWTTQNGSFYVSQWSGAYYQQLADVVDKAKIGVLMHVTPTPKKGYKFKSVTVNGVEIEEEWFVINGPSTIKVNFMGEERSASFTTGNGQKLSFALYGSNNQTPISIDWGNGARQSHTIGTGAKRFDGVANGTGDEATITIYGDITGLDLESWGEYGELTGLWNNKITSVDVSNNELLTYLNTYMNPIKAINISNLKDLQHLDVSYCELTTLDVTNNTNMLKLGCYGNSLETLDLSKNKELLELNAKNNQLESIDLSNNTKLEVLNLNNNKLQTVDLGKLENLYKLDIMGNLLTSIDLSKNNKLMELGVGKNALTTLDLSGNPDLVSLSFNENFIKSLNLSNVKKLLTINCGGNGMTACDMDDFYYNLPLWTGDPEEQTGTTITVLTGSEERPNDAYNADSSIAREKGWTTSISGNASGCDKAYLIIEPTTNGTITLSDSEGNTIKSGDKVAKNSPISIASTPDAGYKLENVKVNGKAIEGNSFSITKLSRVVASFTKDASIDSIELEGVAITTTQQQINIEAPAGSHAEVYNMSGIKIAEADIDGNIAISIDGGTYIVRISNANGTMARVVIVK